MASQYKFANLNNAFVDTLGSVMTGGLTGGVIAYWQGRK